MHLLWAGKLRSESRAGALACLHWAAAACASVLQLPCHLSLPSSSLQLHPPHLLESEDCCFQTPHLTLTETESSLVSVNPKRSSIFTLLLTRSYPEACACCSPARLYFSLKEVFESGLHWVPYKLGCAPKRKQALPCSRS